MKIIKYLGGIVIIAVALYIVIFELPFQKPAPIGAPSNYYQVVFELNEMNVDIYVIGDENFFKKELQSFYLESLDDLTNSPQNSVIILNFDNIDFFDTDDSEKIKNYYLDACNKIVLLNYDYETNSLLNELIDTADLEADMMVLDYTTCGGLTFSKVVEHDDLSDNSYVYTVMKTILNSLK